MTEEHGSDVKVEVTKPLTTAAVEIYIVVDDEGDYEVGRDEDEATERYGDSFSTYMPRRLIKMTVTVPLPRTIEVAAALPEKDDGSYELVIKS
jgi:hypothetical protein